MADGRALRAELEELQAKVRAAREPKQVAELTRKLKELDSGRDLLAYKLAALDKEVKQLENKRLGLKRQHAEELEQQQGLQMRLAEQNDPRVREWWHRELTDAQIAFRAKLAGAMIIAVTAFAFLAVIFAAMCR